MKGARKAKSQRDASDGRDFRPPRGKSSGLAGPAAAINQVISDAQGAPPDVEEASPAEAATKPKAKTREGKKGLVVYVDPEVTRALRKLAANHDTDQQSLALRALELLFREYGMEMPRGAPKSAEKR